MNDNLGITIKKVLVNGLVFVGLIALTLFIVFRNISPGEITTSISSVKFRYVAIGLCAMGIFALGEGLNIRRPLRMFGDDVSVPQGLKYAIIGYFFSSVTPSSTGGQPMQVYYMHNDGLKVSHGTLALLFELLSFETVTVTYALIGYMTQHALLVRSLGNVRYLFLLGIMVNVMVAAFVVMAIFSKRAITVLCGLLVKIIKLFSYDKGNRVDEKCHLMIKEYHSSAVYFKENRMIFVKTLITTAIQILAMFSIPYWVYLGFGMTGFSAFQVISLQAVLFVAVSFLPLPGAVGASEGGFVLLFKMLFTKKLLVSAMVLSRCLSFYLCVIISGVAVAFFTRKLMNKKKVE